VTRSRARQIYDLPTKPKPNYKEAPMPYKSVSRDRQLGPTPRTASRSRRAPSREKATNSSRISPKKDTPVKKEKPQPCRPTHQPSKPIPKIAKTAKRAGGENADGDPSKRAKEIMGKLRPERVELPDFGEMMRKFHDFQERIDLCNREVAADEKTINK